MRVLICGSRDWRDPEPIRRELAKLPPRSVIIHGDNGDEQYKRGADRIADRLARAMGHRVEVFPAEWLRYGPSAGPRRNAEMLAEGKPDLVLAFHPFISKSKGTADMVYRAREADIPVRIIAG